MSQQTKPTLDLLSDRLEAKAVTQKVVLLGVSHTTKLVPLSDVEQEIKSLQSAIEARVPTDKQIQDILIAYKCRGVRTSENIKGMTLTEATKQIRRLHE